ncbi:TonB family protein [Dankookia sp. P2]|uniref:TonB family protein n=1 Tax=Dankookia sp. P2 TaxID=3423955 RepID=UPI003D675776
MAQPRKRRPLAAGLLGSAALHGAAGAMVAVALAWRAVPALPGAEPAMQVVWLPVAEVAPAMSVPAEAMPGAATEAAPLGPTVTEGIEPEDALATQVHTLSMPVAPSVPANLPPLPIPEMDSAELPADPTALFATQPSQLMASLAVPQPEAALPLPPPQPPPAPRPRAANPAPAPAPAQPAAFATPMLAAPAAPAAVPVLSGTPRFRRPPAPPAYPERMREAGIEGTAMLRLRVAADGTTQEIRLLRSAGHRALDEAAEAAARRWEIAPALRNGMPVEAWVEVPVRFRLDE